MFLIAPLKQFYTVNVLYPDSTATTVLAALVAAMYAGLPQRYGEYSLLLGVSYRETARLEYTSFALSYLHSGTLYPRP